jgi:hypothetical protein
MQVMVCPAKGNAFEQSNTDSVGEILGTGVLVRVGVGVGVGVGVEVLVGVRVGVRVGELVGVRVGVRVSVLVAVWVGVRVGVPVEVGGEVWVGVGMTVSTRTEVSPEVTGMMMSPAALIRGRLAASPWRVTYLTANQPAFACQSTQTQAESWLSPCAEKQVPRGRLSTTPKLVPGPRRNLSEADPVTQPESTGKGVAVKVEVTEGNGVGIGRVGPGGLGVCAGAAQAPNISTSRRMPQRFTIIIISIWRDGFQNRSRTF